MRNSDRDEDDDDDGNDVCCGTAFFTRIDKGQETHTYTTYNNYYDWII